MRVIILGSTGSIGRQTIDAIAHLRTAGEDIRIVGLAAGANTELLAAQARELGVGTIAAVSLDAALPGKLHRGPNAAESLVRDVACDLVVSAIVGIAGLRATLAAVELGRTVALANKESLVAGGKVVTDAARRTGARLLPVDSEHAAAWQCLAPFVGATLAPPFETPTHVERLTLTASGGPFREWPIERLRGVTPEEAQRHPTWNMGRKVTIDCASLMNKTLELMEAHWLFGLCAQRLDAIVHPQSVVHAMAHAIDGSVVAQLAPTDMGVPIHRALCWPRTLARAQRLDIASLSSLHFQDPDRARFPAIDLGPRAIAEGGCAGAVLNGANEAAVEAFCAKRIGFMDIPQLVARAMDRAPRNHADTLEAVLDADAWARRFVRDAATS